ncbi:MAG: hypothetical protein M5U08_12525 [Burkholderiales bacterium]|nr:hypothetical protein [Burkholderiales bacterium]
MRAWTILEFFPTPQASRPFTSFRASRARRRPGRCSGEVHDDIFRNERWGWHTDPAAWPKDRSFDSFKQWFRIAFHSIVEDLCDDEIVDEDDEADDE